MKTPHPLLFTLLSLCLCHACGGAQHTGTASLEGAPAWATGDCRSFFEDKPVICGVGVVTDVKSRSLARNAAMGRGRTEIARFLQVRVKSILTDYQAQSGDTSLQDIEETSKQITDVTLHGTRMADHWIGADGAFHALMVLGIDDFKEGVENTPNLPAPVRAAVVQNATKAFSAYDDETSGY